MLCCYMLCYMLYYVMLYVMLCYVMLCYVMLCYVMLCNRRRPHSRKGGYIALFLFAPHKCGFYGKAETFCYVSPLVLSAWY